jgi:ornithine carbamoyltransferase
MGKSLKGRNLVSMADLTMDELRLVLETANAVKRSPGDYFLKFSGKSLAMVFQKPSLRTRVSFEVGMKQMGGHAIYLAPSDISLGKRETTEDIAIVLSRYADLIMARVFGHDIVEDLAEHSTVPVINGLSDLEHPCQILADLQTILERRGRLAGLDFVYSGDGNNVAHSLMYGGALSGMNVTVVTPPGYEPRPEVVSKAQSLATSTGARIRTTNDLKAAMKGADVIYTDVWASMGQEADAENRRKFFMPYQVNSALLAEADRECVILHCLPAHYGEEIEYDVSRTRNSAIFDQAENRLHAQKALMLLLAGV